MNALGQKWNGVIHFANPQHSMIGNTLHLIKKQRVVAIMVIPLKAKQWWSPALDKGAPGVVGLYKFEPNRLANRPTGAPQTYHYSSGYAIVLLDFRPMTHARTRNTFCVCKNRYQADKRLHVLSNSPGSRVFFKGKGGNILGSMRADGSF